MRQNGRIAESNRLWVIAFSVCFSMLPTQASATIIEATGFASPGAETMGVIQVQGFHAAVLNLVSLLWNPTTATARTAPTASGALFCAGRKDNASSWGRSTSKSGP